MKIRLFQDGEPVDVTVSVRDGRGEIVLERPEGARRLEVETVVTSPAAGTLRIDHRPVRYLACRRGSTIQVAVRGEAHSFELSESGLPRAASHAARDPETRSPMPGKVLEVTARVGARVAAGDPLLILEAMKMENVLMAEVAGVVAEVHVAAGDMVEPGKLLVVIHPESPESPASPESGESPQPD